MSTHESSDRSEVIEPGSDRNFGYVVGGILSAIGVYQYFTGSMWFAWTITPGAMLILLGFLAPSVLHPLNLAWTHLGILLGKIVTPVVMLLVYVVSVIPVGLIMRMLGKDLLRLKRKGEESSYWIDRTPPGPPPESLKDQF